MTVDIYNDIITIGLPYDLDYQLAKMIEENTIASKWFELEMFNVYTKLKIFDFSINYKYLKPKKMEIDKNNKKVLMTFEITIKYDSENKTYSVLERDYNESKTFDDITVHGIFNKDDIDLEAMKRFETVCNEVKC